MKNLEINEQWIMELHGWNTLITSIREYSFLYLDFLFLTLRTMCMLSVGGELRLYALYVIDLLVGNSGLVFGNVIVP